MDSGNDQGKLRGREEARAVEAEEEDEAMNVRRQKRRGGRRRTGL